MQAGNAESSWCYRPEITYDSVKHKNVQFQYFNQIRIKSHNQINHIINNQSNKSHKSNLAVSVPGLDSNLLIHLYIQLIVHNSVFMIVHGIFKFIWQSL